MRCTRLIDSNIVQLALILDPRYNIIKKNKISEGVQTLLETLSKRFDSNTSESKTIVQPPTQSCDTEPIETISENGNGQTRGLLSMNDFLRIHNVESVSRSQKNASVTEELFEMMKRTSLDKTCPLKIYYDNRMIFPKLSPIAEAILAIPCSQVSVERSFSDLEFILNSKRSRLNTNTMEDILFVRINDRFK